MYSMHCMILFLSKIRIKNNVSVRYIEESYILPGTPIDRSRPSESHPHRIVSD